MNLLALQASGALCSVALWCDGEVDQLGSDEPRAHTASMMAFIDRLLTGHGMGAGDCDAFVFAAGPGSFTGVRLAAAIAKSLGYAAERPVLAVSSLAAMAEAFFDHAPDAGACHVISDARMGEYYLGEYAGDGKGPVRALAEDRLCTAEQLQQSVFSHGVIVHDGNAWAEEQGAGRLHSVKTEAHARHLFRPAVEQMQNRPAADSALAVQVNYIRGRESWKTVAQQKR